MSNLEGQTILVTGASGGIGREIAKLVGKLGANVIAQWGNNLEGAREATADIPDDRKLLVQADFSSSDGADSLWEQAAMWRGRVNVLVNNAAIMPEAGIESSEPEWDDVWNRALTINVIQPAKLMKRAVNHYLEHGGGVIVSLSSWAAQRGSGNPRLLAYAASKAATAAATKTIARSYAKDNILAYCVAPGTVDTEMTRRSAPNQGGLEKVRAALSTGELVPPREVAEVVCFLAGGVARHLTGATLDVNGATYIR